MDEKTLLTDSRRKNWFWDYNDVFTSSLSSYAILVRLYLARCADNTTRQAFPSLNNIAEHCKISRTTVKKAIAELTKTGWLKKETRREDGVYTSNIYTLCYPQEGGRSCDDLPCNEMTPPSTEVGRNTTEGYGVWRPTVGRQTTANNTNLTIPSIEQEEKSMSLDSNSSLRSELESKLRTPDGGLLNDFEDIEVPGELFEDDSPMLDSETGTHEIYQADPGLTKAPERGKTHQSGTDPDAAIETLCSDESFDKAPGRTNPSHFDGTTVHKEDKPSPGIKNKNTRSRPEKDMPGEDVTPQENNNHAPVADINFYPDSISISDHEAGESCKIGVNLTAGDIIAMLGDSLREVMSPPAKAYAIAGRLYNLYDFPAAEAAINALRRRVEQGCRIQNPIPYLMKIAREKKKEFETGETQEFEEQKLFSEKYPEEHKRRLEEVKKIYAERQQYLQEYFGTSNEQTASVDGFRSPVQIVADCPH